MNRYLLLIILFYSCNNSVKIDDKFSKNNTIENPCFLKGYFDSL